MTPNADELIGDLRKLIAQIDSVNGDIKNLTNDTHEVHRTIKLTKEFRKELDTLNNISTVQPRTSLITTLQDEIKQVQELESENDELRSAIEHHQQVLEIIMEKYREQSKQLKRINILESIFRIPIDDLDSNRRDYLLAKIDEMALVMNKACEIDENCLTKQERMIVQLKQENNRIRKLLLHK